MAKSRLFIACSGRTLEIAKQLRARLNPDYCDCELWNEVSENQVGRSILAMLREATKEFDFALIILAKDDVMVSEAGDKLKARDNCVFEAGLFMGAIGEDRCFLLSSVSERDLPSDLGGIIYLPFSEPADLEDQDACRKAILSASTRVETLVRKAGPIMNRPLSQEKLIERAKRNYEGGELLMDQVVVASVQPLDVNYGPARQVRRNIDAGNIRYVYFFQGNGDGAEKTCQLLQMVLLAEILKSQAEADDFLGCKTKIAANKDQILADLKRYCVEERIKVFFLPTAPALQYCIHNAANDKLAKLYLKHDEEFIEWASGNEAYQFWAEVRQGRGASEPMPAKAVFHGVPGFKVSEGSFYSTLKREMAIYFPGIEGEVSRLCLEGPV
jgi:hypothetical protein